MHWKGKCKQIVHIVNGCPAKAKRFHNTNAARNLSTATDAIKDFIGATCRRDNRQHAALT
jgi:hypothetical protein